MVREGAAAAGSERLPLGARLHPVRASEHALLFASSFVRII